LFTGIVAEIGRVKSVARTGGYVTLTVTAAGVSSEMAVGDSVSVNGVCQTVTARREGEFSFDAVTETLSRTNLGHLRPGSEVNLELALRLGDRIGGHLVSGHIDSTGTIRRRRVVGSGNLDFAVQVKDGLERYVKTKGSVSLDGVSLTVKAVSGDVVEVTVIPFTIENTIIRNWRVGTIVNVEADQLAKYISP